MAWARRKIAEPNSLPIALHDMRTAARAYLEGFMPEKEAAEKLSAPAFMILRHIYGGSIQQVAQAILAAEAERNGG